MATAHALLRSGFPYYLTLGMRRVTTAPMDIGFGQEGRIYVVTRNAALGNGVRRINWDDDNLGIIGEGNFTWPGAILVDEDEKLYVADEAKHTVTVMTMDGEVLSTWGEHGAEPGQLDRPGSMAFDADGHIVISDTMNHRIQKFTRDGKYLSGFGEQGNGDGQLDMPWGITIDEDGHVFVADWRNDRVQKFSGDGEFLLTIGQSGSGKGEFDRPSSVAVDAHGDIYVCDWGNDRVQLFSPHGRYVEEFIGDANMSRSGREYILANQKVLRLREMAELEPARRLRAPITVKVDDEFRMFVCDHGSHRIQVYKKEAYELAENEIAPPMRNPVLLTT
jgi:sugar lactone lactonase YvrE